MEYFQIQNDTFGHFLYYITIPNNRSTESNAAFVYELLKMYLLSLIILIIFALYEICFLRMTNEGISDDNNLNEDEISDNNDVDADDTDGYFSADFRESDSSDF